MKYIRTKDYIYDITTSTKCYSYDTHFLVNCRSLEEYNGFSEFNFCKQLTQEEYYLLKEMLL